MLVSTIKLRQAGFGDCVDTEVMFRPLATEDRRPRDHPAAGGLETLPPDGEGWGH